MNEVFLKALAKRILDGQITIEQVPEVFRGAVQEILDGDDNG